MAGKKKNVIGWVRCLESPCYMYVVNIAERLISGAWWDSGWKKKCVAE